MKKYFLIFLITFLTRSFSFAQLLDNYDGTGGLTYSTEGSWAVTDGQYEAGTGGVSGPEHSYASYNLTNSNSSWELSKSKLNEWIGWMDLNRTSVGGWGGGNYSCGLVLAANSSDLNETSTNGYAVGFRNTGDELVVFRFDGGVTSGTTDLPGSSSIVVSSGYAYSDGDNGINFYVKLESDGKWTIKYKAGSKLSDQAATNPTNYSDGSVTSSSADETYSGTNYKYSGWIYAHSSGGSEKAFFDNFGIGTVDQSLPVTLTSFTVTPDNAKVTLNWTTESEVENLGFNIYKSLYSNEQFTIINDQLIPGHGNTSSRHEYQYIDRNVINGVEYWYQLEDVSYAGETEKHNIVSAIPKGREELGMIPNDFQLFPCYPNQFSNNAY